ncbi:MAG TPA: NUDIX domain-containing protein [Thermohalobaculum sp.]|nr:NUDIX domain-containing protein [Thermohalobaculum sp.]
MERIGEPWIPGRPYRDRIGVYALVAGADGRLLCVHQKTPSERELQLPGGGLEPGEHPTRALHRELREETGWVVGQPRRFAAFQSFTWLWDLRYWARKVHLVYLARAVRRAGPPLEPGHTPVWLTPAEAARRLDVPGDRAIVRRALACGLIRPR